MTISTHWNCQMHQFTLLTPENFSLKSEFYVQANGIQGMVNGNYLKIINMSVMPFCRGWADLKWSSFVFLLADIFANAR